MTIVLIVIIVVRLTRSKYKGATSKDISDSTYDQPSEIDAAQGVNFVRDHEGNIEQVVVSVEDIPLDNRFGGSTLASEHEFTHTAITSVTTSRTRELSGDLGAQLWSIVSFEIKGHIAKGLGVEIGTSITRRVNLKLEAPPGRIVKYRVVWKQNVRRGIAELQVNEETVSVPYEATYGLFHSVESLANEV